MNFNLLGKDKKKILAIDFGLVTSKIVYVESCPVDFKLIKYALIEHPLEAGNPDERLFEGISNFLKTNSIAVKDVVLSISSHEAVELKYLILPALSASEIMEAAKWQLKENIPFDISTALIDWQMVREFSDTDGAKKIGAEFAILNRQTAQRYLAIISRCALNPIQITTDVFNYVNILKQCPSLANVVAVLDIGHQYATLGIYQQDKLLFVRKLTFSSDKFLRSLTGTFVSEKGKLEITLKEAEEIRNVCGIPRDDSGELLGGKFPAMQIISLMRPYLEGLSRELKLSFDYFCNTFSVDKPTVLYITGGGANLKNFDSYLKKELGIFVSYLELPVFFDTSLFDPAVFARGRNQLINALGAAAAHVLGSINLLPREIRAKKAEFIQFSSLRIAGIVIAAVLFFSLFLIRVRIMDFNARLKNAQLHLGAVEQIRKLKEKVGLREYLVNSIQRYDVPADGILKVIAANIPPSVILNELSLDQDTNSVVLRGVVTAAESATESILVGFITKLEVTPFIKEASIASSVRAGAVQQFEVRGELVQ